MSAGCCGLTPPLLAEFWGGFVRLRRDGCSVGDCIGARRPRFSLGCRSSSQADAHAWQWGLHRGPGELRELRRWHLPHRHRQARGSLPPLSLAKHWADKIPPSSRARRPLKEGRKKELEKQGQLKVEIRHHLWKRF